MAKEDVEIDPAPAVVYDEQKWTDYYKPANVTLLIHRRLGLFTFLVGVYYLIHFTMAAGAVDGYSDATRLNICEGIGSSSVSVSAEVAAAATTTEVQDVAGVKAR